ncbi:MAG: DUF485 domain-containing protein [Planctomycetaceae bacterium]
MAGFDHTTERDDSAHSPEAAARNSRRGLALFAVYLVLYGAFVLTNAFAPELMERAPAAGVPLSIFAGFGLIVAAFALALIYGWLCRDNAAQPVRSGDGNR